MTQASIFNALSIDPSFCVKAIKNISEIDHMKAVILTLEFLKSSDKSSVILGASYVLDKYGKFVKGESIKVYSKVCPDAVEPEQYTKISHRYFSEVVPEVVYTDIEKMNELFDLAPDTVKRVL